jgi:hypothetical protein
MISFERAILCPGYFSAWTIFLANLNWWHLTIFTNYVQWRARNFAHIGHFTGIILLKCDTGDSFVPV